MKFAFSIAVLASVFASAGLGAEADLVFRGIVDATINGHAFILNCETNSYHIHCPKLPCPKSGDRISVRAHLETDQHRERIHMADGITVDGHGDISPFADMPISRIIRKSHVFRRIRTRGTVLNAFIDEVDPRYHHLILKDGPDLLHVTVPERAADLKVLRHCVGALVEVTGICLRNRGGSRIIIGHMLVVDDDSTVRIVVPAPANPFDVPVLEDVHHVDPTLIAEMGKRKVEGLVTAVWHGDRFMLQTDDGRNIQVSLVGGVALPPCGSRVTAAGYPDTDLFHVNLINAEFLASPEATRPFPAPEKTTTQQLLRGENGSPRMNLSYHGAAIRLTGKVMDLPNSDRRINLDCDGCTLSVDLSASRLATVDLAPDSIVEVSGICVFEAESWSPNAILPRVKGPILVPRTPDDIRILAHPPWWTTGRLLAVIGSLVVILIGILIWNRSLNHLVERRSRELLKEQIAHTSSELRISERTRLAVELHDSLSQTLAGVAGLMAAARNGIGKDVEADRARLCTAERMLKSCRTELRMCLFDLRSDMLEEKDFATAIRKSLRQLDTNAGLSVRFDARRSLFQDSAAHAILCAIRELVANAISHGHARAVSVDGTIRGDQLLIAVTDDGCGFDVNDHPGPAQGHFGLDGIRDRVKRLDGKLTLASHPSTGTVATLEIPLPQKGERA